MQYQILPLDGDKALAVANTGSFDENIFCEIGSWAHHYHEVVAILLLHIERTDTRVSITSVAANESFFTPIIEDGA